MEIGFSGCDTTLKTSLDHIKRPSRHQALQARAKKAPKVVDANFRSAHKDRRNDSKRDKPFIPSSAGFS